MDVGAGFRGERANEVRADETGGAGQQNASRVSSEPGLSETREVRCDVIREIRVRDHVAAIECL